MKFIKNIMIMIAICSGLSTAYAEIPNSEKVAIITSQNSYDQEISEQVISKLSQDDWRFTNSHDLAFYKLNIQTKKPQDISNTLGLWDRLFSSIKKYQVIAKITISMKKDGSNIVQQNLTTGVVNDTNEEASEWGNKEVLIHAEDEGDDLTKNIALQNISKQLAQHIYELKFND